MPPIDAIAPCPPQMEPDSQWEADVLSKFSELRLHLENLSMNEKAKQRLIVVPPLKDEVGWYKFCLGASSLAESIPVVMDSEIEEGEEVEEKIIEEEIEHESQKFIGEEASNEEPVEDVAGVSEWTGAMGMQPTTTLLLQFDQVMTQRVFGYLVNYLETTNINDEIAKWLYACATRFEKPLHRDVESIIRQVYRRCCRLRFEFSQIEFSQGVNCEHPQIALLNTLIAVFGKYFGQGEHDRSSLLTSIADNNHVDREDSGDSEEDYDDEFEYEFEVGEIDDEYNDNELTHYGSKRDAEGNMK